MSVLRIGLSSLIYDNTRNEANSKSQMEVWFQIFTLFERNDQFQVLDHMFEHVLAYSEKYNEDDPFISSLDFSLLYWTTPLHVAAFYGYLPLFKKLYELSPILFSTMMHKRDLEGNVPLHSCFMDYECGEYMDQKVYKTMSWFILDRNKLWTFYWNEIKSWTSPTTLALLLFISAPCSLRRKAFVSYMTTTWI